MAPYLREFRTAPERELSTREEFLLSMIQMTTKDPEKIVSKLLRSKDRDLISPGALIDGAFYSSFTKDMFYRDRPEVQLTSTALLDHFLSSLDPKQKKKIADDAIIEAANIEDYHKKERTGLGRLGSIYYDAQDVSGKFFVLAQHGGDVNKAILKTTDPDLIVRNADIAIHTKQPLTKEASQLTLNAIVTPKQGERYTNLDPDVFTLHNNVLSKLLASGIVPEKELKYNVKGTIITTKDPLVLAAMIKNHELLDQLIENGHKPHAKELFDVAFAQTNLSLARHLKDLGLDINEKGSNGKTALEDVLAITRNLKGEVFPMEQRFTRDRQAIWVYSEAGEDATPYLKEYRKMRDDYEDRMNGLGQGRKQTKASPPIPEPSYQP